MHLGQRDKAQRLIMLKVWSKYHGISRAMPNTNQMSQRAEWPKK